jgi:hypothetical protein
MSPSIVGTARGYPRAIASTSQIPLTCHRDLVHGIAFAVANIPIGFQGESHYENTLAF